MDSFTNSSLMATLLHGISNLTGKATPIRIGGTTSDQTYIVDSLPGNVTSLERTKPSTQFNITASWFSTFADYFPEGTEVIYCLNLADNSSNWANTQEQASAVWDALGEKLVMFELGNEIDHYIDKGWRSESWGVAEYITQFNNLTASIKDASWYAEAGDSAPKFQAAVFADPPWVPDQQDEIDDFDIVNLTRGGLVDAEHEVVETYSVHLYPQSTCDTERWLRMRLDLLSNHTTLWLNVSQFVPQVAAADAANTSLVFGETNSVSCGGRSGISDTFGAALWAVDYVLMAASIGMPKVYFHLGAQSQYSAFTPWSYELNNETLSSGIRAPFYGHYFVAKVVEGLAEDESYGIAALPGANSSDLSGVSNDPITVTDRPQGISLATGALQRKPSSEWSPESRSQQDIQPPGTAFVPTILHYAIANAMLSLVCCLPGRGSREARVPRHGRLERHRRPVQPVDAEHHGRDRLQQRDEAKLQHDRDVVLDGGPEHQRHQTARPRHECQELGERVGRDVRPGDGRSSGRRRRGGGCSGGRGRRGHLSPDRGGRCSSPACGRRDGIAREW